MNGDIKIGKLLCDEDIITKRQLNKALQVQVKGDKTHSVYKWLSSSELNGWNDKSPKWNFYKYLID